MSTASLKLGTLIVRVERGRELGGAGKSSSLLSSKSRLDPFVAVSLTSSDEQRTSPAVSGGRFPCWEHCAPLKFHLDANARSTLHIDVYDQRTMGGDKKLGRAIVNFAALLSGAKAEIHEWFPLMSEKSGENKGEVRARIVFEHEKRKHDTVVINFGAQPPVQGQPHPAQAQVVQPPIAAPTQYVGMSPPQQFQQPIMYFSTGGQALAPTGQMPQGPIAVMSNAYPPGALLHYPPQTPMQVIMPAGGAVGMMQVQQQYPPNVALPTGGAVPAQHQVFASSAPYPPMMTTMPITHHPPPHGQQPQLDPNLYPPPPPPQQPQAQQYGIPPQQTIHSVYPPQQQLQSVVGQGMGVYPPQQGHQPPHPGYSPY